MDPKNGMHIKKGWKDEIPREKFELFVNMVDHLSYFV